ncbi:MAG: lysophospholipid acyltransferase family protein [bacterium]
MDELPSNKSVAIQPNREHLQVLTPVERFSFRVIDRLNRSPEVRKLLTGFNARVSWRWIELLTSNSVQAHGFENFEKAEPGRSILLAVNHRTLYDQFVIAARLFRLYGAHHNVYFPVRSNFFYDNPTGLLVNLTVAQGAMYPPIVRDKSRRQWNKTATEIMVGLLEDPQSMIGFHPEGTRNKGPDPYSLLPAKPGCGELIYRANPNVIPVFLQGLPKNFLKLYRHNNTGRHHLVHMVMGEPLDFSTERRMEMGRKTFLLISRKVVAGIAALGQTEREIRQVGNSTHTVSTLA